MKQFITRTAIICLLVGVTTASFAQNAPAALNLKQAIETAITNNLQVRQAEYQSQSDKVTYEQAKETSCHFYPAAFFMGRTRGEALIHLPTAM